VALYDLREQVERDPASLTVTMLAALHAVGDSSCLEPVADAWARSTDAWLKDQLKDTFQSLVAREPATRRRVLLKRLSVRLPRLVEDISTPSQTRPSRRRARRA
jgi:hypothetical protein